MGRLDPEYLARRRDEALANAERAATPSIAKVHRDFAAHYAKELARVRSSAATVSALPLMRGQAPNRRTLA